MIVDSSAIAAISLSESEARQFAHLIESTHTVMISASTLLETSIVLGVVRHEELDDLIASAGIVVVPFDEKQARVARRAYVEFGKGSDSLARLNFGNCFSYALAKTTGQPLLFKGDDFTHTDVTPAI